ncbi:TlpA disulfide reductase family protein [Roseivirga sp. E12]|uniref:TlpA family protein disulfide reductase n=1 Tax=Roseivirga sp. E12 TaxID=2819237 RepID=UPI001ABC8FB6|nr:TlpA disulfide reductase family protein [Roseivirga sp. E12]MBO3697048.1 TlpA family protein disulfide reductase [Roseivirga sp. E12]
MKKPKKASVTKRDIIELVIIVGVFAAIYLTGAQAEVFGKVQQVFLHTGVMNASELSEDAYEQANLNFKLTDRDGKTLDVKSLKGQTIFINIWATWCAPCVAEMPGINKLREHFKDDPNVHFLMISEDRDLETAIKWVDKKGFDLPIYKTITPLPDMYETGYVPSTFVISPEGEVVVKHTGLANYNTRRFRKLLGKLSAASTVTN